MGPPLQEPSTTMIRNLPTRQPKIPNLGQALSPVISAARAFAAQTNDIDEDLRAFHAPSECGEQAYIHAHMTFALAVDQAVAMSGYTRHELVAEIKARTGGRWWDYLCYSMGIPYNLREEV